MCVSILSRWMGVYHMHKVLLGNQKRAEAPLEQGLKMAKVSTGAASALTAEPSLQSSLCSFCPCKIGFISGV